MNPTRSTGLFAATACAVLASACGKDAGTSDGGPGLAITVNPLKLEGISEVVYDITVRRNGGEVVWEKTDLASTQFGDGKGGLVYVGPCDASDGSNPHQVELVVKSITETGGAPASFQNPAPEGKPLVVEAVCAENRDTPVVFNLTVMRDANQGFFDVAVNFSDIFCSAKFDCVGDDGQDIDLLHNAQGERDQTLVFGFACTSGAPATAGGKNTTWLHLTDVRVECTEPETVPPVTHTYTIDPSVGEGNIGEVNPIFFQVGDYRDQEELAPYDKCFWNMAFGIKEGPPAANCTLVAQGTASDETWNRTPDDPAHPDGWSPANTVYPFIEWRIPLTDTTGNVTCEQHPLNAGDGRVTTKYTSIEGAKFTHEWQCGSDVITTEKVSCSGNVVGIGPGSTSVSFTQTPDGVSVAFGASPPSGTYKLPAEYGEVSDCCLNPCCTLPQDQ
ncbi:MAG: hypothetical protein U1F43_14165 [Myxococcota bacterium]